MAADSAYPNPQPVPYQGQGQAVPSAQVPPPMPGHPPVQTTGHGPVEYVPNPPQVSPTPSAPPVPQAHPTPHVPPARQSYTPPANPQQVPTPATQTAQPYRPGQTAPVALQPGETPARTQHQAQAQAQPRQWTSPPPLTGTAVPVTQEPAPSTASAKEAFGENISVKHLLLGALAFLTIFICLLSIKTYSDYQRHNSDTIESFTQDLETRAISVSRTIDAQTALVNLALSVSRDPAIVAQLARQSELVQGIAVLTAQGEVLSETDGAGVALAEIELGGINEGGIRIHSLIQPRTGETTPVIVQRGPEFFVLSALRPASLLGQNNPDSAVLLSNGRLIDAPPAIGREGAYGWFELNPARMESLVSRGGIDMVRAQKDGSPVWLGAAPVPKSGGSMMIIDRRDRDIARILTQNLIMFGLMFAGLMWIGWMLTNKLVSQLQQLKARKVEDEISRERYKAALEGSGGGVWEIDLTRNTVLVGASLAEVLRLGEQEIVISLPRFLELFEPSDRDKLYNAVRRAHVGSPFDMEVSLAQIPLILACRGMPTALSKAGQKVIVGVAIDVTEARGTQNRLKSTEARLHDALRSMNDSFVIWDQMGRLVLWNRKFEDFFGFEPGNLQPGMEYKIVQHYANQVIEKQNDASDGTGTEILLKDGRWLRYLETNTVDGGRVSVGTDVTAIRAREIELESNRDQLQSTINVLRESQTRIVELAEKYEQEKIRAEQASQSKSDFLANMSHELRTPLNAINGFSDIMQKEMFGPLGDPRYREYISDILFSGQHLLSLINDILDMSKIEAGKMSLNVETLSITEMITQVLRIVRGRADENRLKLIYEEADTQDIQADPRAVKQVLLNLITNAIKFTPEGGTVTIDVDAKATGIIVHVIDTGIGISEEDIARLAQPFEQIDSQHSRKHEGTGLGLALSKSLIELHGGNFNISSKLDEGTTVTFTLPNMPIVKAVEETETLVGDEITRLAQDIANVLGQNAQATEAAQPAAQSTPPSGEVA